MNSKAIAFRVISICLGISFSFLAGEGVVRTLDLSPKPMRPLYLDKYMLHDNPAVRFQYRKNYIPSEKDKKVLEKD